MQIILIRNFLLSIVSASVYRLSAFYFFKSTNKFLGSKIKKKGIRISILQQLYYLNFNDNGFFLI